MKIRHKKVSSFLQQKRKERLNKSQISNEGLELSFNDSFLDKSYCSMQYSLTEREEREPSNEDPGCKTERACYAEEEEDRVQVTEHSFKDERLKIKEPLRKTSSSKAEKPKNHFPLINKYTTAAGLGLLIGGLIYLIKRK